MDESKSSSEFLPYKMGYLTEEMVARARRELGETEEVRRKSLEQLKAYIESQKNLVCPMDEATLLSYLRSRKFDMKKAISVVNNYFTKKKKHPENFSVENYEAFKRAARDHLINVLPYRDHDECAILLFKFRNWDVSDTPADLLFHFMACFVIFSTVDVATQVCGAKLIADTNGLTLQHITTARLKHLPLIAFLMRRKCIYLIRRRDRGERAERQMPKFLLHAYGGDGPNVRRVKLGRLELRPAPRVSLPNQNAMPLRLKGIHIISDSTAVKLMWNILSYALSDKINKRVRLHGSDGRSLTDYFDPRLLPKEYGGILDFDNSTLIKDLESREKEYLERNPSSQGWMTTTVTIFEI